MSARSRLWKRSLIGFFILSALFHLLTVLLPAPQQQKPEALRFDVRTIPFFQLPPNFTPQHPDLPQQLMQRLASPGYAPLVDGGPLVTPSPTQLPAVTIPRLEYSTPIPPVKPDEFVAQKLSFPDFDSLAIDAVRRLAAEYEAYARFHTFDADTTDAESQLRSKARAVVERAIASMGGRPALLALKEMKAVVWIEAEEHVVPGRPPTVLYPGPYAYPVAHWHYKNWDTFINKPIQVKVSLATDAVNESYVFRNPTITRSRFDQLFNNRWLFVPVQFSALRLKGETARWHFIDRFLGEGIELTYIGREHLDHRPMDVIGVNDRKYAHFFEAFFDQRSGLLISIREGLTPIERPRYRRLKQELPPVWTTVFSRYTPINGVLTPLKLSRSKNAQSRRNPGQKVTIHLKVAYNGAEPETTTPQIWE